jgi:RNA polymerase sigma factor (sigma-70 family)
VLQLHPQTNRNKKANKAAQFNLIRVTFYLPTGARKDIVSSTMTVEQKDELIPTRATLLLRLKNWQDQSSWQDFFDIYCKLIRRVAIKGGLTKTEADEVVQETMIAVARHMPTFKYDPVTGSFKAWLLNLTRWRIADQFRKRKDFEEILPPSEETSMGNGAATEPIDPASENLEALWEAEWEINLLEAAVAKVKRRLEPEKYQIFDFNVNKGWSSEKVAAAFGIPVDHVYKAKHRVTEQIKEEVERLRRELI